MPEMEKKELVEMDAQAEDIIEDIPAARAAAPGKKPAETVKPAKSAAKKPTEAAQGTAEKKPAVKKTQGSATAAKTAKPVQGDAGKSAASEKTTAKKSTAKTAEKKVSASGLKKSVEQTVIKEEPLPEETDAKEKSVNPVSQLIERIRQKRAAAPRKKPLSEKARLRRKRRIRKLVWKLVRRTLLCIVSALLVVVFGVYMILFTVFNGPSQTAADLLVNTLLETSALKFVPRLYYSEEEVQEIIARNSVEAPDEATDTDMVVIDRTVLEKDDGTVEEQDIELVEVTGPTYRGYMMIVKDPSRVSLAVCDPEFDSDYGKFLDEMAEENGAIAAINAGGFEDVGGSGRGGKPLGIVVKDGKVLNSRTDSNCSIVIGFNQEDKLIVGKLDAKEVVELGIRDAASFDTILVLNGEPATIKGSSSGLNPRTAIGQRADGAVLLLVIDGRQVNSLGASMADLIDVMMQFGAVNAANLDGGSSSKMYYQGGFVNDGVALTGSRRLPTAFIVK